MFYLACSLIVIFEVIYFFLSFFIKWYKFIKVNPIIISVSINMKLHFYTEILPIVLENLNRNPNNLREIRKELHRLENTVFGLCVGFFCSGVFENTGHIHALTCISNCSLCPKAVNGLYIFKIYQRNFR